MKLEVFDKKTRQRIGMIKEYTFLQYIDVFNDIGSFSLTLPFSEESLAFLTEGNYIWFEEDVVGIVKYIENNKDETTTVSIKGPLCKKLLDYRVIKSTQTYQGTHSEIARQIINDAFIDVEEKRRMEYIIFSDDEKYNPVSASVFYQTTGKSAFISLQQLLAPVDYDCVLIPSFTNYDATLNIEANISSFIVGVVKPVDRTLNNSEGNTPVVFSTELDNLTKILYKKDSSLSRSVAYVAGEGEGAERKIVEVGDTEATDVDRIEMYVDARDLQSERSNRTTLSEEEYNTLLKQRGEEKLKLYTSSTTVAGTILNNGMYERRVDYNKGDYVSLIDKQLGLVIDVPITKITCSSSQQNGTIYDLTFGYEKATVNKLLKTEGVL